MTKFKAMCFESQSIPLLKEVEKRLLNEGYVNEFPNTTCNNLLPDYSQHNNAGLFKGIILTDNRGKFSCFSCYLWQPSSGYIRGIGGTGETRIRVKVKDYLTIIN